MSQAAHPNAPIQARTAMPDAKQGRPNGLRRVYALNIRRSRNPPPPDLVPWIVDTGFDTVLLSLPGSHGTVDVDALPQVAELLIAAGLEVHLDLSLDLARDTATVVKHHPEWFHPVTWRNADPRDTPPPSGMRVPGLL